MSGQAREPALDDIAPEGPIDSLWSRLRRRKVAQWVLAYLAGAFAVLQGLDLVGTHFAWPGALMRSATVAVGAGLPIALVLAWYHGERGEQHVSGAELGILVVLLVAAGLALRWAAAPIDAPAQPVPAAAPADAEPVVAVLPLANLGADADDGFVAGLHDELIARLGTVQGIAVVSRASTLAYRDRPQTAREIAAALGASHLLEGCVQRSGNTARLRLQLSDARADRQIFTRTLERDLANVFEIQALVAAETAEALRVALSPDTRRSLARRPTTSAEAYEAYLAGRAAWRDRRTEVAAERFRAALAHDPGFVDALALLAVSESLTKIRNRGAASEAAGARAHEALARLEALAPDHPMTQLAAGSVAYWVEEDLHEGRVRLERALEAMPSEPAALALVWISNRLGDHVAADRYLARWRTIEPGSQQLLDSERQHAMNQRDYVRARAAADALLAAGASSQAASLELDLRAHGRVGDYGALAARAGDPTEAALLRLQQARWSGNLAAVRDALVALPETFSADRFNALAPRGLYVAFTERLIDPGADVHAWLDAANAALDGAARPDDPMVRTWRGWVAALGGDGARATALLDEAEAAAERQPDMPFRAEIVHQLAIGHALAGHADRALALAERCLAMYNGCHAHELAIDPLWAPLRRDPRFVALIDRHLPSH